MTALVMVCSALGARADDFKITPSVALRQEFNSNLFFSFNDETDDYITTLIVSVAAENRTERLDFKLDASARPFFQEENDELNAVDQTYQGRMGYRLTERLQTSGNVSYRVDNRPDRDVADTGLLFSTDRRDWWHVSAGAGYTLNEITAASLNYSYDDIGWDAPLAAREDSRGHAVQLSITRNIGRWLEETTGLLTLGYSDWNYETSDTGTVFGSLGVDSALTETLNLRADIGGRYVNSTFETVELVLIPPGLIVPRVVEKSNAGWGAIGSAGIAYRGERTTAGLNISTDLRTQGGATPSVLTRLTGSLDHRVLKDLRVGLTSGVYRNKADREDFSFRQIDTLTYRIGPRVRWEFWDDVALDGAYTFAYVDDEVAGGSRNQHRVYVQVAYGFELPDMMDAGKGWETTDSIHP